MPTGFLDSGVWVAWFGRPAAAPDALSHVLAAVGATIVAADLYQLNQVFLTLDPDPWPTQAGPFCAVRPGSHDLIEGQWEGGGTSLAGYTGRVVVRVLDQALRDPVGRDEHALLDSGIGLLNRGLAVVRALTSDAAEAALLESPVFQRGLKPLRIAEPTYRRGEQPDRRWRGIDLVFGVQWTNLYG